MAYHVRIEQFEGPLELLLQLIEKEKLDVTRVSLASVADQYLEHIAREDSIPLAHLAQFLSVAARLLLLKSRALLPLLQFTEEEEQSIDDLEWQLREYRRFRTASQTLGALFRQPGRSVRRESFLGSRVVFFSPRGITASDLRHVFEGILGEIPVAERLDEEELRSIVTLEEKMSEMRTTLATRMEWSFRQMTADVGDKLEVIVAFLALLELVKQRFVHAEQNEVFSDIAIQSAAQH
jgi:segregation and condensation protein A